MDTANPAGEAARKAPENRTRFQPGQTGNAGGRPKASIREAMRRKLEASLDASAELGDLTTQAGDECIQAALNGDRNKVECWRAVIAEVEGPHKQEVELSGEIPLVLIKGFDSEEPTP